MKKIYHYLEDANYLITYGKDRFTLKEIYKDIGYIWDSTKLYSLCLERNNEYFTYFYHSKTNLTANKSYKIFKLYDI